MKKQDLTEKEQQSLKTFQNFKTTYPNFYRRLIIIAIAAIAVPFVIWGFFLFGNKVLGIPTNFSAGEVLGFYGAILAFLGTVVLGIIAVWQNNKASKLNIEMQKLQQANYVSMVSIKS